MKYRLLAASTALLFTTITLAFDNEPDGFRGIKWGTPFSANAKEMTLIQKSKDMRLYFRKGDKMSIGAAELKQIIYTYQNDKFFNASFETRGVSNKSALIETFRTQFGLGTKPNQFLDKYTWYGASTSIILECSPIGSECKAFFYSTEMISKKIEQDKKAAEGAAKDF